MTWFGGRPWSTAYAISLELRQLFVDMCIHCNLSDPSPSSTPIFTISKKEGGRNEEVARNSTLRWIQEKLQVNGFNMEINFQLQAPNFVLINRMIADERGSVDRDRVEECMLIGEVMRVQLNDVPK